MPRIVALFGLLLVVLTAVAHAYHVSIMEARLNPKTQQLEVAVKVFTDDLETTLSQGLPKPVSVIETPAAQLTPLITAYLRRTVVVGSKVGEQLPLTYVGMEREKDAHWLYFTVKFPQAPQRIHLRHRLLLDQFPDQMNIVNLEAGGKKQSAFFRHGNEEQTLTW